MAELTDTIYDLIAQQPDKRMKIADISRAICEADTTFHPGDVRRAVRMLVDAERINMMPGGIVVIEIG
jgi:hypothetical protein